MTDQELEAKVLLLDSPLRRIRKRANYDICRGLRERGLTDRQLPTAVISLVNGASIDLAIRMSRAWASVSA